MAGFCYAQANIQHNQLTILNIQGLIMLRNTRILYLSITVLLMGLLSSLLSGCAVQVASTVAGTAVGVATGTAIEVAKVPFKVGGAAVDVVTGN